MTLSGLVGLAPSSGQAGEVTVEANPSKSEVTVGEAFTVEVAVTGAEGGEISFPATVKDEKIELRARVEERPRPDVKTYEAAVFALEDVEIPPIAVRYRLPDGSHGEAKSAAVPVHVTSLLPRDPKEQKLADIRPPVPLTIGRAFFVALGLVVLVLAAALYWLWRRRRPVAAVAPAAPKIPADVAARAALDRLAASGRLEREEYRPFYIELAEIAKRYLEQRLGAPVLEMTTAETVAFLREDPRAFALADVVRDLAGAADQIKFARGQGARERALAHLEGVRRLVDTLETQLRPNVPLPMPAPEPPRRRDRAD